MMRSERKWRLRIILAVGGFCLVRLIVPRYIEGLMVSRRSLQGAAFTGGQEGGSASIQWSQQQQQPVQMTQQSGLQQTESLGGGANPIGTKSWSTESYTPQNQVQNYNQGLRASSLGTGVESNTMNGQGPQSSFGVNPGYGMQQQNPGGVSSTQQQPQAFGQQPQGQQLQGQQSQGQQSQGPAVTGPAVTGPTATGPAVTEPAVTGANSYRASSNRANSRKASSHRANSQRARSYRANSRKATS